MPQKKSKWRSIFFRIMSTNKIIPSIKSIHKTPSPSRRTTLKRAASQDQQEQDRERKYAAT